MISGSGNRRSLGHVAPLMQLYECLESTLNRRIRLMSFQR